MPNTLDTLSHLDLLQMRAAPGADQSLLAPLEHQAFAREYASENPILALGLLGAIPAYQAAKAMGVVGSRTGGANSMDQMFAGFRGLGQGWGAVTQPAAYNPAESAGWMWGRSPIDRRGSYMGAAPIPPIASQQPPAKPPTGPGAVKPAIPGYEREFGVINQQTGGIVPHQSTY